MAIEFDRNSRKNLLRPRENRGGIDGNILAKIDLRIFSSINPYIIDDVKRG